MRGARSNQSFHLKTDSPQPLPLSPTIALVFQPSYLPMQRCHEGHHKKSMQLCAAAHISHKHCVNALTLGCFFFFSFSSFLVLAPSVSPTVRTTSLTLKTEPACFPPTLCLWFLGKAGGNGERERRRWINSCFCLEAVTLHQEHFLFFFLGRQGASCLFYLSACPFRAERRHSR